MNIYNFKVDFEESKILDEDFESFMDKVITHKTLFNIGGCLQEVCVNCYK